MSSILMRGVANEGEFSLVGSFTLWISQLHTGQFFIFSMFTGFTRFTKAVSSNKYD